jgi:ATP-dependent protease La (LON) substrate-binding domain/Glyoxalase superfamily protein
MAQTPREALTAKSVSLTHSESLELVAKVLGLRDWNVLSARIQSEPLPPDTNPLAPDANLDTAIWVAATPAPAGIDLPVVPLRDIVLFPQMISPIYVGRVTTRKAVECAMAVDKRVLAVTQRLATDDNPTPDALYGVGVTASVIDVANLFADGSVRLIFKCLQRAAIEDRIFGVAQRMRHLAGTVQVAVEGMGGILLDGAMAGARRRIEPAADADPSEAFGRELGNLLRGSGRGCRPGGDTGENRGGPHAQLHLFQFGHCNVSLSRPPSTRVRPNGLGLPRG